MTEQTEMTNEERREVLANIARRRAELDAQCREIFRETAQMDKIEAEHRAALAAAEPLP